MNPATTQNSAANSTPPAEPAESQSAEVNEGAHIGDVTAADVAAALGLPPEGQETETEDADDTATETEAEESADETEDDSIAGTDSGESEEAATPSEVADETGEPTNEETEATAPAGANGKKNEAFQQRIDELTKARKEAETEAAALREKMSTYRAREEGDLEPTSLANVDTPEELAAARARFVKLHKWALANPDGGTMPDAKGGETEFSREEVARIQANTFSLLNETLPIRQHFINARMQADAEAMRSYPWIADRTKGDGLALQRAIESLPILRMVPEGRIIAANALVGNKLRSAGITVDDALIKRLMAEQQAKGPARKAAPARAPAAPGRVGSLPARRTPAVAQERAMVNRLRSSSGSVADLAASIAAKMK